MPYTKGLYEHNLISQVKLPSVSDPFDINDTQALHFLGTTVTDISGGTSTGTTVNIGTVETPNNVTVSKNDVVLYGSTKTMYQCSNITTSGEAPSITTTLHWSDISPTATEIPVTDVKVDNVSVVANTIANMTIASFAAGALANGMTATTQDTSDNSTKVATTAFVKSAISGITNPMIFKGSATLAASGDITVTVPALATDIKQGFTYKVTTSTYVAVKVGDTVIAAKDNPATTSWSEEDWTVIPSGDEPAGTVTEIEVGAGLTITDATKSTIEELTESGTISLNLVSDDAHETATATTVSQVDHIYPVMIDHNNNLAVATNKDTIMNTVTDATIANPVVTAVAASTTSATGNVDLFDVTNGVLTLKYLAPTTANNAVFQVTPSGT